jgi:hypothetical protein
MYRVTWRNVREGGSPLGTLPLPQFGQIRIGRAKDADIWLDDSAVSRSHAIIICNGERIEIADSGSSNGTSLGRAHLTHSGWNLDDEVVIGPFELRLSIIEGLPLPPKKPGPLRGPLLDRPEMPQRPARGHGFIDARPRFVAGSNSLWDAASHRRDTFAGLVQSILDEHAIEGEYISSQRNIYPPNVSLRCWLPKSNASPLDTRMRSAFTLAVDVKPYHKHKFEHSVSLERGGKKYDLSFLAGKRCFFNENDLREWVVFAIGKGPRPYTGAPLLLRILTHAIPGLAFRNKISRAYRDALGVRQALRYLFYILLAIAFSSGAFPPMFLFSSAAAAALGLYLYLTRAKEVAVCTPPTPAETPRRLSSWGSWDIVLPQLGGDFELTKSRILQSIAEQRPSQIETVEEIESKWTPSGLERRPRMVYRQNQSEVHLHIYSFGPDLFVGWNAYINYNQWGETEPITSKYESGMTIEFREVKPANYSPTEFDWIDLRGLADYVHRRLEQTIRRMIKERNIDIELDFRIDKSGIDQSIEHSEPKAKKTGFQLIKSQLTGAAQ